MKREESARVNWAVIAAGGIVVIAAAAVAVQVVPQLAPVRQYQRDAQEFASQLPQRARSLLGQARDRLDQAKHAFRVARAESERVLIAQFEEAKQRGSVPPV